MFDDSELQEIRGERGEWERPPDFYDDDGQRSYTHSTTRAVSGFAASTALVVVIVAMMFSMNLVGAVGITQVGGFDASFPELNGTNIAIYPAIGETAACKNNFTTSRPTESGKTALPVLKADMQSAEVTKPPVELTKNITMPSEIETITDIAVIQINLTQSPVPTGTTVTLGNASLQLTHLRAEQMDVQAQTTIFENYSNGAGTPNPIFGPGNGFALNRDHGEWAIHGENVLMTNGTAQAHFLGFDQLTNLQNMVLKLEYFNTSNPPTVKGSDHCYNGTANIF